MKNFNFPLFLGCYAIGISIIILGILITKRIRDEWGREVKRDYKFEDISHLYRYMDSEDETQSTIDDQRWHDLNMNSIFKEDWIEIQGMGHPLIHNAVPNSVRLGKNCGLIVTGSNMSGKSTFMRIIGVNVVFAQTIYTCLADTYEGGFFRIMTSISQEDE